MLYLTEVNIVLVDVADGTFFQASRVSAKVVIPAFLAFKNLLEAGSVPRQAHLAALTRIGKIYALCYFIQDLQFLQ